MKQIRSLNFLIKRSLSNIGRNREGTLPSKCNVAIIGGGIMGSSTAFWLKRRSPEINVMVFEKDPTYATSSTTLSVGGLRQQFSLGENIRISLFGWHFIQNINEYLGINGETPNISFKENGYLTLAYEKEAKYLEDMYRLQRDLGAHSILLNNKQLKEKFPWMNTKGIALGVHGLSMEGWFDPWSMLLAFRKKAISLGVEFIDGEVINIHQLHNPDQTEGTLKALDIALNKSKEKLSVTFDHLVLTAGASSGKVAKLAGIGTGEGVLAVELPIEPRKRYVYYFTCPNGPPSKTSLVLDATGAYFRPEGAGYIGGKSPLSSEEPSTNNLDVDYDYFEQVVWPDLANLVPAFESLKVNNAWSGFYEFNYFDENGVVGVHPYYKNLYIASGFSGHGIQQGPAIGRAMCEMIFNDKPSIDLSRFSFNRLIHKKPLLEQRCV